MLCLSFAESVSQRFAISGQIRVRNTENSISIVPPYSTEGDSDVEKIIRRYVGRNSATKEMIQQLNVARNKER